MIKYLNHLSCGTGRREDWKKISNSAEESSFYSEYGVSGILQNVRNCYVNENLKYQTLSFSPTLCYFLFLGS